MRPLLKPNGWDALAALLVILLAAGCWVGVWHPTGDAALYVEVSIDGRAAERFSIEELEVQARIYTGNGYTLRLAAEMDRDGGANGVRVEEADCPTQDCVRTGIICRRGQSIVCLPARIVVRLAGGGGPEDVDAVIG